MLQHLGDFLAITNINPRGVCEVKSTTQPVLVNVSRSVDGFWVVTSQTTGNESSHRSYADAMANAYRQIFVELQTDERPINTDRDPFRFTSSD